ncbi:hypothetical protein [Acidithiobacillus caldus]|uniref:Conjugal transfer protein TrbJ n=1 Tax=Acidithiobacillus caldus TaxID=33059 RepID=A0A1E7YPW2_9PROT|nr:hypothetical protein [Acidithiobacillus caldus]OFC37977.1 hypothetical protein BAE27_03260 [Acidithiobacillus caldus]OFC38418.1 hypothetical protein BAE28_05595 [Acidithiobacillus caldus]OFC40014.1 hypothetical protein BAE29_06210 [Acidithiobacillus caldus]OFC60488.1 hypothetical protein BAE30_08085 [Acidithiobacillus caldus]
MYTKHSVLPNQNQHRKLPFLVGIAAGIIMIPLSVSAGTLTGGATLPEQIVQEATALQTYAKNVTTALASVQNEINTLNSYMTELQNLASLPARELSKLTMPIQQMEYNYDRAQELMSEYQSLYGNLSNIQQTVEQQNLDILNSSLSPEDYLNTVETAQTNTAAETRAQIASAARSMQAVDSLTPKIEEQSQAIPGISGNTAGQMQMASELNTIEQQNQLLLSAIDQAQLARSQRRSIRESEDQVADSRTDINALTQSAEEMKKSAEIMQKNFDAEANAASAMQNSEASCIDRGGTYLTCYQARN